MNKLYGNRYVIYCWVIGFIICILMGLNLLGAVFGGLFVGAIPYMFWGKQKAKEQELSRAS